MASYDGRGGRGQPLGQSARSRTVDNPYGGYSDTEVMGPTAENRLYGRDPYQDHPRDDRYGGMGRTGYYDDHRSAAPPLRPSGASYGEGLVDERVRGPPPPPRMSQPGTGSYERGERVRRPIIAEHAHGDFVIDSDIESITSAFSSHSAPHARGRRPG